LGGRIAPMTVIVFPRLSCVTSTQLGGMRNFGFAVTGFSGGGPGNGSDGGIGLEVMGGSRGLMGKQQDCGEHHGADHGQDLTKAQSDQNGKQDGQKQRHSGSPVVEHGADQAVTCDHSEQMEGQPRCAGMPGSSRAIKSSSSTPRD
jgi:hypothetical protein